VDEDGYRNTTARPAPDSPPGLEGGVTLTNPNTNTGRQNMTPSRPKLLSPKYHTQIGTWNVRTMYQVGKVRKPATNITRLSLEWNPQGVRRKGRPKKSWRRTIQQEYEDLGLSWDEVKWTVKNRVRWKAVVEALCSGRSEED